MIISWLKKKRKDEVRDFERFGIYLYLGGV